MLKNKLLILIMLTTELSSTLKAIDLERIISALGRARIASMGRPEDEICTTQARAVISQLGMPTATPFGGEDIAPHSTLATRIKYATETLKTT